MGLTKYFEDEYLSSFSQEELLEFQQDEKQEQEKITKFPNKRKPKPNQTIKEPTLYPKLLGNKRKILLQNARYDEETVSLIRNDPRKLFLDQIKKIDYEIKKCKKKHDFFWKYNRNKKADQAILAFHGGVLPIVSSLSFFITILLICLKKDLVIETSYKLIFIPIEILWWCIVYIGFCFNLSREDMPMYVFGRALYLSGFFTFWFTLLLSIKLDDEDIFPWFVILIPHFLSFGAWIYFCWHIFSRIREEDNFLVNIFVLHIIIYHTFFSLFLVLIVLNKHDIGSISQNSLFYYMFAVCFSPVFFAIFWPFFIRYCRRKIHSWSDLHHLPDFYGSYFEIDLISFGMLMIPFVLIFVQLLIIYLKLNQKIFCEWIVVGTPSFISLGIFLIISVVGEILYAIDEYF
ncbi:hypothetical protein M0811_07434 [Anaeramoeba ignava]|uniref:Transmembrane protein n=1 Tax=Anaeramoeba ignava TaxID=1746090 RepID=A0A9Q0RE78_ANAIG|nr:hypothetical protein M0811_07434 [Anaeramoeba ignava]